MASPHPDAASRAFISYRSPHRLFGLSWGTTAHTFRLAASTFIAGEYVNKLQILHPSADGKDLVNVMEIDHPYPPTKVVWSPASVASSVGHEYLATSADYLRLWKINPTSIQRQAIITSVLCLAMVEQKQKQKQCAPLTSLDWSVIQPSIIGTCSTDLTCTIWDLNSLSEPKQQIVAHDGEAYDIAFSTEQDVFASVGDDGSMRLFDLRSLEHSTIVYESPDALLRLAWNKLDEHYIATIPEGSSKIIILDLRRAGSNEPLMELEQHAACVNSISWSPHSRHHICSAADDCCAIVYDISAGVPDEAARRMAATPPQPLWSHSTVFRSPTPINQIRWSPTRANCIALCDEEALRVVQL